MADLTTKQARAQLSEIINRSTFGKERLFVTHRGKRTGAVVPIEDIELLETLEDPNRHPGRARGTGGSKKEEHEVLDETRT